MSTTLMTIAVIVCWLITGVLVVYTSMLWNGKGIVFIAGWNSMSKLERSRYNKKKVYRREAQTMLMLTVPFVAFTVIMHLQLFPRFFNPLLIIVSAIVFFAIEVAIAVIASLRGYKGCEDDSFAD